VSIVDYHQLKLTNHNMAKAKVIFDLNDPDDIMAHKRFMQSTDMALAMWEFKNTLWRKLKHVPDDMPDDEYKAIQSIQKEFLEILEEYNLNLDNLVQ
jgi:hypothetical protein